MGVVFSLSMGLGPFVETNPVANKVGKKVGILGTNLTGATGVTFHGVAASFEVKSPTLIVAEVPSGATTGKVQVQLPSCHAHQQRALHRAALEPASRDYSPFCSMSLATSAVQPV